MGVIEGERDSPLERFAAHRKVVQSLFDEAGDFVDAMLWYDSPSMVGIPLQ